MKRVSIDPLTRIEGHMKIEAFLEGNVVKDAKCSGTLFRGFEIILKGRDPRDAQRITQRVCGVCPAVHCSASTLNLDSAFNISDRIPDNARLMRNLILGSNYLQSHILHFYHLTALDFVDITSVADYNGNDSDLNSVKSFIERGELAPFVPRYEGDYRFDKETNQILVKHYLMALEMRKIAHEMLAIFGGKMPHNATVVPGGITENPSVDKITDFLWKLKKIKDFIDNIYLPDVIAVAKTYSDYFDIGKGPGNFLCYGSFDLEGNNPDYSKRKRLFPQGVVVGMSKLIPLDTDKITESVKHSWYEGDNALHPYDEDTIPNPRKKDAYSWIRSPRYDGMVCEVGPLARWIVAYFSGKDEVKKRVDNLIADLGISIEKLNSVMGRHATRALDAKMVAENMVNWVLSLDPKGESFVEYEIPEESEGMGIVDGPRGALGHWIKIKDKRIEKYQLVVPTTWNGSPMDEKGQHGPMEQSLIGTTVKDPDNPFELVRIARSFDPCLACSVHAININNNRFVDMRVV